MVSSRYNFFEKLTTESYLAYNSRTNAMLRVTSENYENFSKFCEGLIDEPSLNERAAWRRGGFLVPSLETERGEVALSRYRGRFSSTALNLTIAPTLLCNFRCIYCYEKGHNIGRNMQQDVQDAIIELVEQKANTIELLNITWYGGEPLIAMDTIRSLSKRFVEICKTKYIQYSPFVVTNGSLLTPDLANELV